MNQFPVTFEHPWWLAFIPAVIVFFVAVSRHSCAAISLRSARLALGLRLCGATLLILALAAPHLTRRTDRQTVLFLLDVSQSIRPDQRARSIAYINHALAHMGSGDQAGVIVFGTTPTLTVPPTSSPSLDGLHADAPSEATDLSAALRLAQATFPNTLGRKIVLLSDGTETRGDAFSETDSLRLSGTRVDLASSDLDLSNDQSTAPEALIENVRTPNESQANAAFPIDVNLSSTIAQEGELTILRDGRQIAHRKVLLTAGRSTVSVADRLTESGLHRYEALLKPAQDGIAQNNQAASEIVVRGRPHILYITDDPATAALPHILAAQGMDVTTSAPGRTPTSAASLTGYDAVVLSDVPASEFSSAQMTALRLGVRSFGVGLGMIGGPNSFGAGRWADTAVEDALPVKMEVPRQRRLPPAAVVIVLDASGSMARTEDGVEKVQLGARAAVQLMQSLQPDDQVAVLSVTTTSTIVVPLQPARNVKQAQKLIEDVHAGGGGIYCRQGLQDAYSLLVGSKAAIKHVILVADTTDSEQQGNCAAIADYIRRQQHITTTVCGIGSAGDTDAAFQQNVAKAGGGQWAAVTEAADLPQLFRRDVQTLQQSWYLETPTLAISTGGDDILSNLSFRAAPPLFGHNVVTAKPGTFTALRTASNDPLFIHGQSGLGRTFAFASDDRPHWAARWLGWGSITPFWAQTVRWTLRGNNAAPFAAALDNENGRGHLTVDAQSMTSPITAIIAAPDLSTREISLTSSSIGRADADFDADQPGTYLVSVRQSGRGGGARTLRFVVPYAPEYRTLGANLPLLTHLADETGGRLQIDPARVFADRVPYYLGDWPISPILLLLCALLFVGDVAVRRLALTLPALRLALQRAPVAARKTKSRIREAAFPSPATLPSPQVDTLLSRRVTARAPSESSERDAENPFPHVASLHSHPVSRRHDE